MDCFNKLGLLFIKENDSLLKSKLKLDIKI